MKTFKPLFALMAMLLCSTFIFAHNFEVDGVYYNITSSSDKTVAVTYWGDSYDSYLNEYSGSVTIPESVTYNGTTYSVTSIGSFAFSDCSGLTSVTIGNSVTSIGSYAFWFCSGLTSVEIPNSVTSIGRSAFDGCSGLTSVTIPNSVTSIGNNAFSQCYDLISVTIPNSVTSIGEAAFSSCLSLTSIIVDGENTTYDSRDNCNAIIETSSNTLIAGCKSTIIPNSVTSIGSSAFYRSGLTSIEIPNSVTSIGRSAFDGCSGLTSVTIPNSVTSIGSDAFRDCYGLTSIIVDDENTTYDSRDNCNAIIETSSNTLIVGCNSTIIPNSVTSIGGHAFSGSGLTSIEIPNSVTSIEGDAFYDTPWYNAKPDGLVYINNVLYKYKGTMPSGTTIEIKEGTISISSYAFNNCSGLTSIEIPNSVTSIGVMAFNDCSGLTSIEIPNSVTSIGGSAFSYCSGLTSVTIPNSVTSIGVWVFSNCSGLTSIEIPNSVTSIESYAFNNCSGLTSVTIPNSVTSIGGSAFSGCSGLKSITSYIPAEKLFTPPTSGFEGVDKTGCILYVPKGAKGKYATTGVWKDFMNIVEILETYKVTFVVDGEVFATDSVTEGNSLDFPNVPEKEGYTFLGWSETPETMPANDVTITGEYKVNSYAVKYVVDGVDYATDSVAYGSAITLRDKPTKEGYTFLGWSEAPETMPANDVTITGEYKVNTYTVMYVVDGEVIVSYPVEYGKELVMLPLAPEKEGHTFMGWSELPATMPAEDVTVTGTFKVNAYAVTYVVDGVTVATDSVVYGTAVTLIDELEKEGYSFSWSEAPEAMPANDITIIGEWSINSYLVTFIIDGVVYTTDSVEYGAEIVLPEVPEKENSTFEWEEAPTTMPANDVTIYGNYVSGIGGVTISGKADVYNLNGILYKRDVDLNKLYIELPKGGYIINGKKYMVR